MMKLGRPFGIHTGHKHHKLHTGWKKGNIMKRMLDENDGVLFTNDLSYARRDNLIKAYKRMRIRGEPVIRFEGGRPSHAAKYRSKNNIHSKIIIYYRPWKRQKALKMYFEKYSEETTSPQRKSMVSMAILDGEYSKSYDERKDREKAKA